ncbi:DUF86 domain-containing protein [Roseibium salinum]|nr:DUF86 domain-containing protein [Roseibium salinum]
MIGESVKALPEDLTSRRSEIPWRTVARFRDRVVHEYFSNRRGDRVGDDRKR